MPTFDSCRAMQRAKAEGKPPILRVLYKEKQADVRWRAVDQVARPMDCKPRRQHCRRRGLDVSLKLGVP